MPIENLQKKTQHVNNIIELDETFETSKEVNHKSVISTPSSFMASLNYSFEASSPPPPPLPFFGCFSSRSKRVSKDQTDDDDNSHGDRRYKRMMKNRESAARSRARRQAYTSELESEIVELKEENAKLRKHQIELLLSAPVEIPKRKNHNRSMTAPF